MKKKCAFIIMLLAVFSLLPLRTFAAESSYYYQYTDDRLNDYLKKEKTFPDFKKYSLYNLNPMELPTKDGKIIKRDEEKDASLVSFNMEKAVAEYRWSIETISGFMAAADKKSYIKENLPVAKLHVPTFYDGLETDYFLAVSNEGAYYAPFCSRFTHVLRECAFIVNEESAKAKLSSLGLEGYTPLQWGRFNEMYFLLAEKNQQTDFIYIPFHEERFAQNTGYTEFLKEYGTLLDGHVIKTDQVIKFLNAYQQAYQKAIEVWQKLIKEHPEMDRFGGISSSTQGSITPNIQVKSEPSLQKQPASSDQDVGSAMASANAQADNARPSNPNAGIIDGPENEPAGSLLWLWITLGGVVVVSGGVTAILWFTKKRSTR